MSSANLPSRLTAAAERVHAALVAGLDVFLPPPRRPHDLVQQLGLDKTLASRIHRTAAAPASLEAVLEGAGIQGLRLVVAGLCKVVDSRGTPVDSSLITELDQAIAEFASVCEEFPDGRVGLETAMADLLPSLRDQSERRARRAVWHAHSFLLGFTQEVLYKAFIRLPSREDPRLVDTVYVEICGDFRRLRAGSQAAITGLVIFRADEQSKVRSETIDGAPMGTDAMQALMLDRCTQPLPPLKSEVRGNQVTLMLDDQFPVLGPPITITLAQVTRNGMRRFGRPGSEYDTNHAVFRRPIRTLVWDHLTHLSLAAGPPEVTASFASAVGGMPASPADDRLYAIRQPEEFQSLGVGLGRVAGSDLPDCRGLLQTVLDRLGANPAELGVHRLRIEYPIPHTRYVVWTRLLPGPV